MKAHSLPIEIDPRPCQWCGLEIDHHHMIDDGDGPHHFCISEVYERIAAGKVKNPKGLFVLGWNSGIDFSLHHVAEEEISMIMEGIMIEPDCVPSIIPPRAPEPYRTPQSTIDTFKYLVRFNDPERLKAWLADRPQDAPTLLKLLESKR
jgi:hypothetical protein